MNRSSDNSVPYEFRHEESASTDAARICPACGAISRRADARFCATCGREFDVEGYLPLDSIRASYHLQNSRTASVMTASHTSRAAHIARPRRRANKQAMPFTKNSNGASTTALAFVTYALVPYLVFLLCPGALLWVCCGLRRARRMPHVGGRRASVMSISMGLVIFGVQLILWWILYKMPEWSRHNF